VIGDLVTTWFALSLGLPESNPVVRVAWSHFGFAGFVGLKIALLTAVVAGYQYTERKQVRGDLDFDAIGYLDRVMKWLLVPLSFVGANNLFAITVL
jgi:hypothetical protein